MNAHAHVGHGNGEILGMFIGTALAFSNLGTVALSVALAFVFGVGVLISEALSSGESAHDHVTYAVDA